MIGVNGSEPLGTTSWNLRAERLHGCSYVSVAGEVDIATAPELTEALDTAIREAGPGSRVVVDLSAVAFFASAGVTALVRAADLADRTGASLRLVVGPSRLVTRPLQVSGADKVLSLYETVDEAVR